MEYLLDYKSASEDEGDPSKTTITVKAGDLRLPALQGQSAKCSVRGVQCTMLWRSALSETQGDKKQESILYVRSEFLGVGATARLIEN